MTFDKKISNEHIQKLCSMMYTQVEKDMETHGKGSYFSSYTGGVEDGFYPVGIIMVSGLKEETFKAIDMHIQKALSVKEAPIDTINPND